MGIFLNRCEIKKVYVRGKWNKKKLIEGESKRNKIVTYLKVLMEDSNSFTKIILTRPIGYSTTLKSYLILNLIFLYE